MLREIVMDTETTGLDPDDGHRIVEIGAVELLNHIPSGLTFHQYVNPQRDMPAEAFKVHGLSAEFLADFPKFADIANDFLEFVDDSALVIHNAGFDLKFLNAELAAAGCEAIDFAKVIDSLSLARQKHPAGPNSLDALCRRFGIDNSRREKHGALLDSELLAEVYLELIGGRQTALDLSAGVVEDQIAVQSPVNTASLVRPTELGCRLSCEERHAHGAMVEAMGAGALWNKYRQT